MDRRMITYECSNGQRFIARDDEVSLARSLSNTVHNLHLFDVNANYWVMQDIHAAYIRLMPNQPMHTHGDRFFDIVIPIGKDIQLRSKAHAFAHSA